MSIPGQIEEFKVAACDLLRFLHGQRPDPPPATNPLQSASHNSNTSSEQDYNQNRSHLDRQGSLYRMQMEDTNANYVTATMCSLRRFPEISESYLELTMEATGIRDPQSATRVMLVREEILKLKQERGLSTTAAVKKLTERIKRTVVKKQTAASLPPPTTSASGSSKKRKHDGTSEEGMEPPGKRRKTKDKDKKKEPKKPSAPPALDAFSAAVPPPPNFLAPPSVIPGAAESPISRVRGFFSQLMSGLSGNQGGAGAVGDGAIQLPNLSILEQFIGHSGASVESGESHEEDDPVYQAMAMLNRNNPRAGPGSPPDGGGGAAGGDVEAAGQDQDEEEEEHEYNEADFNYDDEVDGVSSTSDADKPNEATGAKLADRRDQSDEPKEEQRTTQVVIIGGSGDKDAMELGSKVDFDLAHAVAAATTNAPLREELVFTPSEESEPQEEKARAQVVDISHEASACTSSDFDETVTRRSPKRSFDEALGDAEPDLSDSYELIAPVETLVEYSARKRRLLAVNSVASSQVDAPGDEIVGHLYLPQPD